MLGHILSMRFAATWWHHKGQSANRLMPNDLSWQVALSGACERWGRHRIFTYFRLFNIFQCFSQCFPTFSIFPGRTTSLHVHVPESWPWAWWTVPGPRLGQAIPWRQSRRDIPWDTLRCLQCFKLMEFNGFQWIQEVNGTCVMTPIQIIQHREARMPYKHRIWWLPKFDCSDLAPGWWETLSRLQAQDPSYGRAKTVLAEAYQKQGRKHPETPANMVWLTPQHLPADSENGHSWHLWNDPKYMNIRMERLLQRVKS